MTKTKIEVWLCLALVAAFTSLSGSAAAQLAAPTAPAECSAGRDLRGWNSGRTLGESRLLSVWRSAAVNQDLDELSARLPSILSSLETAVVSLAGGQQPSQYVRCRAQGFAEWFFYRLNLLFGQCVLDGADWGQFAANVYCSLSLELDGLSAESMFVRAPTQLCGTLFEQSCEDVYQHVATEGLYTIEDPVASILDMNGFTPDLFVGCAVYTTDPFQDAFEVAVFKDCSYEPVP